MVRAPLPAGIKIGDIVVTNDAFARSLANYRRPKLPLVGEVVSGSWDRGCCRVRFGRRKDHIKISTSYFDVVTDTDVSDD